MRMKNTLERLQAEFESFIHEEMTAREQTDRARSESGYYSVMSTSRLTDRSSRSSTARSFMGYYFFFSVCRIYIFTIAKKMAHQIITLRPF